MGQTLTAEQQKEVEEQLSKQADVVKKLYGVIEQQSRLLAEMSQSTGVYNEDDEVDLEHECSGGSEIDGLVRRAGRERKEREDVVDAEDKEEAKKFEAFPEEPDEEARNFMSVKPWLGAMAAPTNWKKDPAWDEKPDAKLELEYVHGYRARGCRNNIYWVSENTVVYPAAAVGVVLNLDNNTQQFFMGHDDDIICLDFHKKSKVVATGQSGKQPAICVWDAESCQGLAVLKGFHQRGVVSVAFSADGNTLASVGLDNNHSIAVYDWKNKVCLSTAKGSTKRILEISFDLTKTADPNNDMVSVGEKHIYFWSLAGRSFKYKKGLLGRVGKRQTFTSVAFTADYTLVGCMDGSIYIFKGRKLQTALPAHTGMIQCMQSDGTVIFSGAKDGKLHMWDALSFKKTASWDMNKQKELPTPARNRLRAVDIQNGKLIVGTICSEISTIDIQSGKIDVVHVGHHGDWKDPRAYGELWGLYPIPGQSKLVTCADDSTLRIWDVQDRKMVRSVDLLCQATCCTVSPDGRLIAVGFKSGSFAVYDATYLDEEGRFNQFRQRVTCLKFSPDNKYLAVASADTKIKIYDCAEEFTRVGYCKGHSSTITHLDWCKHSKYIQTTSAAAELLFYEANGEQVTKSRSLKDVEWATQECVFGWNVQGIWPKFSDATDVNMINVSNSGKYLASAEDSGCIKLFNYPCIGSGLDRRGKLRGRPDSQRAYGHSEHVTNVNWLTDDSYVVSTGGADLCVMQWKVVKS